ncbi:hypothetical protein WICPIJ_008010 [Wickerhamomyces pijperi]|uniref:Uncharacterized protein n=1 Tax=Wickerhamomyces pijperi TaxID=599730 RepID=A0A9P8PYP2_WICPI|nr:hypothetical protein WICPIJ_008010 [Wickerhamomyces pijperi]
MYLTGEEAKAEASPMISSKDLNFNLASWIWKTCSGVIPASEMMAPLESDKETTLPPNSITFKAAYWATLPEPEMATFLPVKSSLPLNLLISLSDLPFGLKSEPPLPPPMFKPVKAFLKICSKPKNFKMDKLTDGCNLKPPLYGPKAELNWTLKPLLISCSPLSFSQETLNWMILSGTETTGRTFSYFGSCWNKVEALMVETTSL